MRLLFESGEKTPLPSRLISVRSATRQLEDQRSQLEVALAGLSMYV